MPKNMINITKGDGTTMSIDKVAKASYPELSQPIVTEQFYNTKIVEVVEGEFTLKHNRKMLLKTNASTAVGAEAALAATDEVSKKDKETLEFDKYLYKKLKYNKKIDARVWEGQGAIVDDLASLKMDQRETRAQDFYKEYIKGIKAVNTLATGAATGKTYFKKGADGNDFTAPVIIKKVDKADASMTAAKAKTFVANIFMDIDSIREMGIKGKDTEMYPHGRGTSLRLAVITRNAAALALAELNMFQETGEASSLIKTGLAGQINSVPFVVDPRLPEGLEYMIVALGSEAPIFVPDRAKFDSSLKDHPDFSVDFWRLAVSASNGTVFSNRGMVLTRCGSSLADLTTLA